MLETPTAIANAKEIAAVPGVNVLLIGTNDLCAEMGIHGDFGNERVADAYRTMIAAARKHGKFPGMAGVYNETIMPPPVAMEGTGETDSSAEQAGWGPSPWVPRKSRGSVRTVLKTHRAREGDRGFESSFLQQPVCLSSEP